MEINVLGPRRAVAHAQPYFAKAGGGVFVATSSIAALFPVTPPVSAAFNDYFVSKAALNAMMRGVAVLVPALSCAAERAKGMRESSKGASAVAQRVQPRPCQPMPLPRTGQMAGAKLLPKERTRTFLRTRACPNTATPVFPHFLVFFGSVVFAVPIH